MGVSLHKLLVSAKCTLTSAYTFVLLYPLVFPLSAKTLTYCLAHLWKFARPVRFRSVSFFFYYSVLYARSFPPLVCLPRIGAFLIHSTVSSGSPLSLILFPLSPRCATHQSMSLHASRLRQFCLCHQKLPSLRFPVVSATTRGSFGPLQHSLHI